MDAGVRTAMSGVCVGVGVVACLMNVMVMVAYLRDPRTLKPMHCYLLSDCLTNVLAGIEMIVLGAILLENENIPTCLQQFLLEGLLVIVLITGLSSFVIIAAERYRALVLLIPPVSVTKRLGIIVFLWTSTLALLFLRIFFVYPKGPHQPEPACFVYLEFDRAFWTTLVLALFVAPCGVALYLYGLVIHKLWRRRDLGSSVHQERKKQAIKAMVAILVVFSICWTPFLLYRLSISWLHGGPFGPEYTAPLLALYVLGYSQSAFNALLYVLYSQEFRETLRTVCQRFHLGSASVAPAAPVLVPRSRPSPSPLQPIADADEKTFCLIWGPQSP